MNEKLLALTLKEIVEHSEYANEILNEIAEEDNNVRSLCESYDIELNEPLHKTR